MSNATPPSDNPNGLKAVDTLGDFLAGDGWHPHRVEGQNAYRMHYSGKNGDYRCFAQIMVNLEQFIFYAIAPVRVPDEDQAAVVEFITRANYGLRIGNFELDYADGEVRYKTSMDFESETLTHNLIRNMVYPAVTTLDHYFGGLMKVIFGGRTPVEAIEEIEGLST